jgi:hypothetical protein
LGHSCVGAHLHKSLLAALAATLLVPAAASAATGGTATKETPFRWSGGPGQGLVLPLLFSQVERGPISEATTACTEVETCDDTLVKIEESGDLTFTITGENGDTPELPVIGAADLDLYIFASDAQGAKGEPVAESATGEPSETVTLFAAEPGYYLVQVRFYHAVNATFDASATLTDPVVEEDG